MMDINELIELEPYKSCYEYGYEQGIADERANQESLIDTVKTEVKADILHEVHYLMNCGMGKKKSLERLEKILKEQNNE